MDGFKEFVALTGVLAGAFKMVTSALKDLDELNEQKQKRRSPGKKKRRK